MNYKKPIICLLVVLVILVIAFFLLLKVNSNAVIFICTADTKGLIQPCGCTKEPGGGLPRKATLIKLFRAKYKGVNIVPVEISDPFAYRSPSKEILNNTVAKFLGDLKYGCAILSGKQVSLGRDEVYKLQRLSHITFLSCEEGLELPKMKDFYIGGRSIGSFQIGAKKITMLALNDDTEITKDDPVSYIKSLLIGGKRDYLIVAGTISPDTAQKVIKSGLHIDMMICTNGETVTSAPAKARNTWVAYLGERSRRALIAPIVIQKGKIQTDKLNVVYLGNNIPDDKGVADHVKLELKKSEEIDKQSLESCRIAPKSSDRKYVGAPACAVCHKNAYRIWILSDHAKSLEHLKIDHQENNPECLKCHTTGLGKPYGFVSQAETPELVEVQCEACHGPMDGHPRRKTEMQNPLETCITCHTEEDSPNFNSSVSWGRISHGRL